MKLNTFSINHYIAIQYKCKKKSSIIKQSLFFCRKSFHILKVYLFSLILLYKKESVNVNAIFNAKSLPMPSN